MRAAFAYATHPDVDVVVIAARWYFYFANQERRGAAYAESTTASALTKLREMISLLVKEGKQVYVILDNPVGATVDPHQLVRRVVSSSGFRIDTSQISRELVERALGLIARDVQKAALESGATVINPLDFLCGKRTCPVISTENEPIYRDMWNLEPSFVRENAGFIDVVMTRKSNL